MVRLQKELSASAVEVASTSLWGHLDNFFLLPFVFACLLVGTFITYHALVNLAYHRFWDVLNVRAFMREVVWWNGQLLYLPVTLAASRALACETFTIGQYQGQSRVAVDPNLECGGVGHTLLLVLCVPLLVIWGVGVPAGIAWHVSSSLVFPPSKPHRHERFLRWKESEYAFGITVDWRREHMWMFSSFVRRWWHPYNRAIWYSMLGLLVLLHALMRSMPEMQVNFFFALVFAWTLRMVLLPAYRVGTSSALCLVIWSAASFNAIYSVIRANGVVSALTIDSEYFAFMQGVNSFFFAVVLVVLGVACSPAFTWPRGMVGGHQWRSLSGFSGDFFNPKEASLYTFRGTSAAGAMRGKDTSARNPYLRTAAMLRRAVALGVPASTPAPAGAGVEPDGDADAPPSTPSKLPSDFTLAMPPGSGKVAPLVEPPDAKVSPRAAVAEEVDDSVGPVPRLGLGGGLHADADAREGSAEGGDDPLEVGISDAVLDELLTERDYLDFGDDFGESDEEEEGAPEQELDASAGQQVPGAPVPTYSTSMSRGQRALRARKRTFVNRAISLAGGKRRRQGCTGWCESKGWYTAEFLGCAVEAGDVDPHTGQAKYLCCPWLRHGKQATSTAASLGQAGLLLKGWTVREYLTAGARSTPLRKWFSVLPGRSANTSVRISQLQSQRLLTPDDVAELEMRWMLGIRAARTIVRRSQRIPPELVDTRLVRRLALALRMEHRMARRMRHVLAYSLQDTLDELALVIDRCAPVSIFPNATLERLLPGLRARMAKREKQMALVDPRLRRILLKLFALKAWMGSRPIKSCFPEDVYASTKHTVRGLNATVAAWLTSRRVAPSTAPLLSPPADQEPSKPADEGGVGGGRLVRKLSRRNSMWEELQLLARAQAQAAAGGSEEAILRQRGYSTYTLQQLSSMAFGGSAGLAPISFMPAMDLLQLSPDATLFAHESSAGIQGDFGTEVKRRVLTDARKRSGLSRCRAVLALLRAVRDRWRVILVNWEKAEGDPGCVPQLLRAVQGVGDFTDQDVQAERAGVQAALQDSPQEEEEGGGVPPPDTSHVNTVPEALGMLTGLSAPDARLVVVWYDAYLAVGTTLREVSETLAPIMAGLQPPPPADAAPADTAGTSAREDGAPQEAKMPGTLQAGGAARSALSNLLRRARGNLAQRG